MPRSVTVRSTGCIVAGRTPSSNRRRPEPSTSGNQTEAVDELVPQQRLEQFAASPDLGSELIAVAMALAGSV
jgi:hypothetical protein